VRFTDLLALRGLLCWRHPGSFASDDAAFIAAILPLFVVAYFAKNRSASPTPPPITVGSFLRYDINEVANGRRHQLDRTCKFSFALGAKNWIVHKFPPIRIVFCLQIPADVKRRCTHAFRKRQTNQNWNGYEI